MKRVQVLPAQVAQLIAAGEVVERPASVIKELVENAIDSGATMIRIDVEGGGVRLMRVTDNGCGMSPEDATTCFLRHATSKIKNAQDINGVLTLGFRGEALASIAAVSHVRLVTKTSAAVEGTCVEMDGGVLSLNQPIGAPDGTTITVENLFYNTPARKKFLKSERSETGAINSLIDKLALSHPEISFRYYCNSREQLYTPGDGLIASAASAVLGVETVRTMIEVNGGQTIQVQGIISKPLSSRGNRNHQYFFINGRCVTSGLLSKALESAYAGSIMTGKYPVCVLCLTLDAQDVDVNVHPSKSIVKFTDEKVIFHAVYAAVSDALTGIDQRHVATTPNLPVKEQKKIVAGFYDVSVKQPGLPLTPIAEPARSEPNLLIQHEKHSACEYVFDSDLRKNSIVTFKDRMAKQAPSVAHITPIPVVPQFQVAGSVDEQEKMEADIVWIGEIFNTYIIAQCGDEVYFVDKHAAHERLIFEKIKDKVETGSQPLLIDQVVSLTHADKIAILEQQEHFNACGFELEDYGGNAIMVRAIPAELSNDDIADVLEQSVAALSERRSEKDKKTRILEVMACKAAVKGGQTSNSEEQKQLLDRLFSLPDVKYCPHGRPIIYTMTKKDFEKMFKRIVS